VTSSGSQLTVYRRPARTFVLPAPRVQDGLTISPSPFRKQADSRAPTDHIPDNGQAERMNRTIKDATIKTYHYGDLENLKAHVMAFVTAYNFAKHSKALKWRTPYQVIREAWTKDPSIFKLNPRHLIPGPHI
jgi:Integrase core domain